MKILVIFAAAVVLLFVLIFVYISAKLFKIACVREGKRTVGDGFEKQMSEHKALFDEGKRFYDAADKKDVYIQSRDGLKLHGVFVKNGEGKKIIIQAHGFRSVPRRDFSVVMPYFYNKGFSFLMFDQRAHGESEGEYITYGVYERYDLLDWISFVISECGNDAEILLHGISMGAATVLMASGLGLPDNVKAIIADCGYTSPRDIYTHVLATSYNATPFPILTIAGMIAKRKAKFGFKDASTLDAMEKNTTPVLFVHGEEDAFVPIEMTERNFEACKAEKKMLRVKGALHACSYLVDKEKCEKEMDGFLANKFKNE